VAQEIEIHFPGDLTTSDDEIAERAVNALRWDTIVPDEKIQLTLSNGVVTLRGEVAWHFQRSAAENAVRRLGGVTGVLNAISIKPHVEDALKRHADVEAKAIRVSVADDRVTLDGKVDSWDEREAVENAAWSAPGVRLVEDHLTIGR
jgi:osmotically-inducible protein OsmY